MNELQRSESEWGATKVQYQKHIEQLQGELEDMQRECALVQGQVQEAIQIKEQKSQMDEERSILEKRIADQTRSIQKKQQEFTRMRELRHQDQRKIREME